MNRCKDLFKRKKYFGVRCTLISDRDKERNWFSTKTRIKDNTNFKDSEVETGHHFSVVLRATWWSYNMQRSCQRHSCILLEATVSPNPACCSGQDLQPLARFQPCCLQTTDCCTGFQISFQGRMSMRTFIGSIPSAPTKSCQILYKFARSRSWPCPVFNLRPGSHLPGTVIYYVILYSERRKMFAMYNNN